MMQHLAKEGEDSCGLETAEVEQICDNSFSYLRQLLMHPTVNEAVTEMARALSQRQTLSREEIMTHLIPLSRL